MANEIFKGGEPIWANACVGNNGNPDYVEYSEGYAEAANILLTKVLEEEGKIHVDTLIYPICFNMRHAIELSIKGAIEEITKISEIKNKPIEFNFRASHDLAIIWNFFKKDVLGLDKRYEEVVLILDHLINDIAEVDATGQTFRYPFNNESQKHLTDISVISLTVLQLKFHELEKRLKDLHWFNITLLEEYKFKTFTKTLSRDQLFQVAKLLPPRDKWEKESFNLVKNNIKKKYGLSSRELSKALDIIQENYEMAYIISKKVDLLGVDKEQVLILVQEWIECNLDYINEKKNIEANFELASITAESLIMRNERLKVAGNKLLPLLTVKNIAGISSLFYFADDLDFSEKYKLIYQYELKSLSLERKENEFFHIFRKTNFIETLVKSLRFLKHFELVVLIKRIQKQTLLNTN